MSVSSSRVRYAQSPSEQQAQDLGHGRPARRQQELEPEQEPRLRQGQPFHHRCLRTAPLESTSSRPEDGAAVHDGEQCFAKGAGAITVGSLTLAV